MSGAIQATFMNQRSFGPPPPGAIGSAYQGGFYAGQISTTGNGVATHYLVIGPVASAQNSSIRYKNTATANAGADSVIDGPQNTADMVAEGSSTVYPAAHFCNDLTIGGFSDWYLPAKNELEICYYNLKPSAFNNNAAYGANTNAVPSRGSNYTNNPRVPNQTSVASFQTGGAEAFALVGYWTSTELSSADALKQEFLDGAQQGEFKSNLIYARAVRRVAI